MATTAALTHDGSIPDAPRDLAVALKGRGTLRKCAILHLDGSERLRGRTWAREVAVEFLESDPRCRGPLSWLVAPEEFWPRRLGKPDWAAASAMPGPGQNAQVARELADALEGHRVYAGCHLVTGRWTRSLFGAAGMGAAPFEVEDFRNLADWADPTAEDVVAAEHAAELVVGLAWRAPCEAIRRAEYARTLAVRHSARVRRAAGSASP